MVDYRAPAYQFPYRKPTGPGAPPLVPTKNSFRINPNHSPQNLYGPPSATSSSSHTRRRTSSSGTLPMQGIQGTQTYTQNYNYNYGYPQNPSMNRRPSVASNSRGGTVDPITPITIRRSSSTHTTNSASSAQSAYVATLRRQKATVWCERSQPEDPRLLLAQRTAKLRAAMEVVGSSSSAFLSAGHNHHGIGSGAGSAASSISAGRTGKLGKTWGTSSSPGIGGGSLPSGVPARLSATEVLGDDDEDELYPGEPAIHKRSGSGKSSLNSNHRRTNRSSSMMSDTNRNSTLYNNVTGGLQHRNSRGSTPSYSSRSSVAEEGTHGSATKTRPRSDKFTEHASESSQPRSYYNPALYNTAIPRRDNTLKRRGSLDEQEVVRTMTLSGNRLFVANPDVE